MKIIVDDKIPYLKGIIEKITPEVLFVPGKDFNKSLIKDADALIVRTRTLCNQELLEGSSVKFIATATIGYDHIDTDYCGKAGITWTNAPGCNANSVAQYIESSLLLLKVQKEFNLNALTIGIVGVGNVGKKVADVARNLGMRVLLNDPPREKNENIKGFYSLEQLAQESDIITFHVPLNQSGAYKTLHLGNQTFFSSLKRRPIIINTSRGEVLETEALLEALEKGEIADAIIDVWENEPNLNLPLLEKVFIGTPHIAGYSADGKANATRMSLDALCRFFNINENYNIAPPEPESSIISAKSREEALLQIYNPTNDSQRLKEHPEQFEFFRGNYPLRREKNAYHLIIEK